MRLGSESWLVTLLIGVERSGLPLNNGEDSRAAIVSQDMHRYRAELNHHKAYIHAFNTEHHERVRGVGKPSVMRVFAS
jgi:hypothetical protein